MTRTLLRWLLPAIAGLCAAAAMAQPYPSQPVKLIVPYPPGGNTDIVATIKVLGAFLFFPLTWIALGTAAGLAWGLFLGLLVGFALPPLGYLALLLLQRWERTRAAVRALVLSVFRRRALSRLRVERTALVAEMQSLDALARQAERRA